MILAPHVILNGVDFQAEDIGLQALYIFYGTKKRQTWQNFDSSRLH